MPTEHDTGTVPSADQAWRDFRKLMADHDEQLAKGWSDEIDGLLLLAGLFSAVVTAFLVESYQTLQPDPHVDTIILLTSIAHSLNSSVPQGPLPPFQPTPSAIRLNVFWFLSLALALIDALFGLVVKQWLHEFLHSPGGADARMQIRVRQFKYEGLMKWRVPEITVALSLILQAAVILFLTGMMDFLWHLQRVVAVPIIAVTVFLFMLLSFTTVLAPLFRSCPYRSAPAWICLRVMAWISTYLVPHFLRLPDFLDAVRATRGTWTTRDVYSLTIRSPDSHIGRRHQPNPNTVLPDTVDRMALNWMSINSLDPVRSKAILICALTIGPSAIIEAIARELGCRYEDFTLVSGSPTKLEVSVLQGASGKIAATLEVILDVLLHMEGAYKLDGTLLECFKAISLSAEGVLDAHEARRMSFQMRYLADTYTQKDLKIVLSGSESLECFLAWTKSCYRGLRNTAFLSDVEGLRARIVREEEDAFREAVEVAILAVLRILDRVDVEQVLGRAHPSLPAFQATEVDTYLALDEVLSLRGVDNLFKGVIHTYVRTTSRSRPLRHTLEICSAVVRCGARLYPFLRPGLVSGILFSAVSEATNRGIGRAWMKDTLYLFVWALFCGDRAKLYTDDSLFSGYLDPSCYEVPSESSSGYETKRAFDLAVHTVCCFLRLDPLVMKDQRILVFLLAILQARMVLAQQRGIPVHADGTEDRQILEKYHGLVQRLHDAKQLVQQNSAEAEVEASMGQIATKLYHWLTRIYNVERRATERDPAWDWYKDRTESDTKSLSSTSTSLPLHVPNEQTYLPHSLVFVGEGEQREGSE